MRGTLAERFLMVSSPQRPVFDGYAQPVTEEEPTKKSMQRCSNSETKEMPRQLGDHFVPLQLTHLPRATRTEKAGPAGRGLGFRTKHRARGSAPGEQSLAPQAHPRAGSSVTAERRGQPGGPSGEMGRKMWRIWGIFPWVGTMSCTHGSEDRALKHNPDWGPTTDTRLD